MFFNYELPAASKKGKLGFIVDSKIKNMSAHTATNKVVLGVHSNKIYLFLVSGKTNRYFKKLMIVKSTKLRCSNKYTPRLH